MRSRCAELMEVARHAKWDQVDVGRLVETMEGLEPSGAESVVAALVEQDLFEQAGAVVIAAHVAGCAVPATVLDPLAYSIDKPQRSMLLARAVAGDPVDVLVRLWESGRMCNQTESLVAYLLAHRCDALPLAAISRLRLLCRMPLPPGASVAVGEAVRLVDDCELSKVGARHLQAAKRLPSTGWLERQVTRPVFELLPERAARNVVSGRTVQRRGEEVGRNDPCPCDSGRKYKRCCLRKQRRDGGGAQVQPSLTDRQFRALMPHEVFALDYEQFDEPRLAMAFEKFVKFSHFDRAAELLTHMQRRGVDGIDEHRSLLVERALFSGELEVVRRQAEQMDPEARRQVELDLFLSEEELTVAALDERALDVLGGEEAGDGPDEVDLAVALLRQRPALGIFVARGAMSAERLQDAEMLAQCVEEVRDTLMLPPEDRAGEIRDLFSEQRMESDYRALIERISTERQREAAAEAEELRKRHARVRRERQELQAQLSRLQRGLASAERPDATGRQSPPEHNRPGPTPPHSQSGVDVGKLRQKVERLKDIIDEKNDERSKLRQQVCELHGRLDEALSDDRQDDSADEAAFEELEEIETADQEPAFLLPRFDRAFRDALTHLPTPVVRRAVTAAAELATSSTAEWTGVKRLKTADAYTRRLGRDWRMFFRLEPESTSLIVLEVVSRQDFERALLRYRR